MVWAELVAVSSLLLCNYAKSLFGHVYYTQNLCDFGICILILNGFTWGRGCLKIGVAKCDK